ncbi:MAG: molecular chaperone DnaJ [Hyphomicrobiales bacterium]|nr:MAG: molecular chaperone DnaJ [Hyphomicrobiales bacterium]
MALDSKLFDKIRIKPDKETLEKDSFPTCDWEGCSRPGSHRAPMGRDREGQYFNFCLDHVRLYNKSYNYFTGMDDSLVARYLKEATIGHRPTWRMGVNRAAQPAGGAKRGKAGWSETYHDPFQLFGETGQPGSGPAPRAQRRLNAAQSRAFDVLKLEPSADRTEIKARFKELVKKHHPDANGGDRSSEERLRQIIQAYNALKQAGFC